MLYLINQYATKYAFDPAILWGICMTESSMNPKATRYEPNYVWLYKPGEYGVRIDIETRQQKTSFGLMQVMGAVLREYGYKGTLSNILKDPEAQLDYGCRHLAKKIKRYGLNLGIACYNSGSPIRNPDGTLKNANYIKKVLEHSKGWANG